MVVREEHPEAGTRLLGRDYLPPVFIGIPAVEHCVVGVAVLCVVGLQAFRRKAGTEPTSEPGNSTRESHSVYLAGVGSLGIVLVKCGLLFDVLFRPLPKMSHQPMDGFSVAREQHYPYRKEICKRNEPTHVRPNTHPDGRQ